MQLFEKRMASGRVKLRNAYTKILQLMRSQEFIIYVLQSGTLQTELWYLQHWQRPLASWCRILCRSHTGQSVIEGANYSRTPMAQHDVQPSYVERTERVHNICWCRVHNICWCISHWESFVYNHYVYNIKKANVAGIWDVVNLKADLFICANVPSMLTRKSIVSSL